MDSIRLTEGIRVSESEVGRTPPSRIMPQCSGTIA